MNLARTNTIECALDKGYPVYVVFETDTKDVVEWWAFGEALAKGSAETRCNKHGPESYDYADWPTYEKILARHEAHLRQLEEIESRL